MESTPIFRLKICSSRFAKRKRGATLVEFALVLPFVLALMMGIIEFGWLMRNQALLANASREGARYAAIGHTQDDVYDRVVAAAQPLLKVDANGDITNGDVFIEQSADGVTFVQFPTYQYFPVDACPTSLRAPQSAKPQSIKPQAQLLATRAASPQFLMVRRPVSAPTPTPAPTFTPAPTATPAPTPTPLVGATPTPTDVPVPPPGSTPVPGGVGGGLACHNTVPSGYIIRIRVEMNHTPLTRFFPFLNNRTISVQSTMRRE